MLILPNDKIVDVLVGRGGVGGRGCKLLSYLSWNWSEAQTFVLHPVLFLIAGGWEQSIIIHVLSIFSGIKFMIIKFPESFLFNSGKLMVWGSFWGCYWIWLGHKGRFRFCGTWRLHNLEDTIKKTIQKYLWIVLGKRYDFVNTQGTVQVKAL